MTDDKDAARTVVREELVALRKLPGPLTPSKLAMATNTCFYLCGGDPQQSYQLLFGIWEQHQSDKELRVAIRSLGFVSNDNHTSVLARLNSIGSDLEYEQRQVRRFSDTGIARLAGLIVDSLLGASVWVDAYISEDEDGVFLAQFRYQTPPSIKVVALDISLLGTAVDPATFDTTEGDIYSTSISKPWRAGAPPEREFQLVRVVVAATAQTFFTASSIVSEKWRARVITSRQTMTIDMLRR